MIKKDDNTTLIISYSKARARKDRHNRERGLKKLEKQLSSGKLTKANINNRGYNKYLKLEGEVKTEIDKEKICTGCGLGWTKGLSKQIPSYPLKRSLQIIVNFGRSRRLSEYQSMILR
jgi:hypothetical protein